MEIDIKKIKNKVDTNLITVGDGFESVKYIRKKYQTHNHHELLLDFIETPIFKSVYDNTIFSDSEILDIKKIQEDILIQFLKIQQSLIDEFSIRENIKEMLILQSKHIISNKVDLHQPFRFYSNPWACIDCSINRIRDIIPTIKSIDSYQNDPETNNFKSQNWNEILTSIWSLLYAGFHEEGLFIVKTLENLIYKIYKYNPENVVFEGILNQPSLARFLMSIYFVKAKLFLLKGDKISASEIYEKICSFSSFNYENISDYRMIIFWYTGQTRIVESAIELYKLNPTEKNRKRCIDFYLESCKSTDIEPTEALRERGYITFSLAKYILDINFNH